MKIGIVELFKIQLVISSIFIDIKAIITHFLVISNIIGQNIISKSYDISEIVHLVGYMKIRLLLKVHLLLNFRLPLPTEILSTAEFWSTTEALSTTEISSTTEFLSLT